MNESVTDIEPETLRTSEPFASLARMFKDMPKGRMLGTLHLLIKDQNKYLDQLNGMIQVSIPEENRASFQSAISAFVGTNVNIACITQVFAIRYADLMHRESSASKPRLFEQKITQDCAKAVVDTGKVLKVDKHFMRLVNEERAKHQHPKTKSPLQPIDDVKKLKRHLGLIKTTKLKE